MTLQINRTQLGLVQRANALMNGFRDGRPFEVAEGDRYSDDLILPVTIEGFLRNGSIAASCSLQTIAKLVSEGRIVILKNVFEPAMMLDFRSNLNQWSKSTPALPHGQSASSLTHTNYHRIDDGTSGSVTPHIFHQFGFSRLDILQDEIRRPAEFISETMRELQNAIAETHLEFSATGLRLKILHYPAGGGFLVEHVHPYEPQRVGLIASMSRIDKDFRTGATLFDTPFGRVNCRDHHDLGDIVLFRYDLPHAVNAVDADKDLNWDSEAGKWSIVLELRQTYGMSSVTEK